jgi:hypothetical protein
MMVAVTCALSACGPQESSVLEDPELGTNQQRVVQCSVSTTIGGYLQYGHFTYPPSPCVPDAANPSLKRDFNILYEWKRLVDSTQSGDVIRGNIFNATADFVPSALKAAMNRGVLVYVSFDGGVAKDTEGAFTNTTYGFNTFPNKTFCKYGSSNGCLGTVGTGIAHTKAWTFSRATAPNGTRYANVTWISSANMTYGSGTDMSNNSITTYGDATLYNFMKAHLTNMYNQSPRTSDYYDSASGRGYLGTASQSIYASPEAVGQTDIVLSRINDLTPDALTLTAPDGSTSKRCQVRVQMLMFTDSRIEVAKKLAAFGNAGCEVRVLIHRGTDGRAEIGSSVLSTLKAANNVWIKSHPQLHDKAIMMRGNFGGVLQSRTFGGSHNLTGAALHENDEIFTKLTESAGWNADGSMKDRFHTYFVWHFGDSYYDAEATYL